MIKLIQFPFVFRSKRCQVLIVTMAVTVYRTSAFVRWNSPSSPQIVHSRQAIPVPQEVNRPIEESTSCTEVIDVRSPSEFAEDHLVGAVNLPVLSDEERHIMYKENPFEAKKKGAAMVSRNIAAHLETHFYSKPGR
jgi:hypothetical protein